MKYLGQHIFDFNLRARADVFLESIASGTIASGGMLGLDSDGKVVKANVPTSHDAVTLAGTPDYITISGQEITRNQIDLANDVTGTLPVANGGTGLTSLSTLLNSNVDHDALTNFVAAEHYRWDNDISSTATIHTNNITDLHGAGVSGSANQLLTDDGDGTVTSQSNVTYSSSFNLFTIQSGTSQKPILSITNANEDAEAPELQFRKAAGLAADGDQLGKIEFRASDTDNTGNDAIFAQIVGEVQEADNNSEEGKLTLNVASHDQELQPGLIIASGNAEDEVDVTIGSEATSVTTIAGTLTMGSTATINNSGLLLVAGQTNITSLGTLTGLTTSGSIELGHASDTTIARSAAGKVTIEGANVQTTQICTTHHNMSLDGSSSTVDYYFPINSLADGSSSSLYYTRVVAAYNGKIVKMLFRPSEVMGSSCTIYMSRRDHDGTSVSHQTSGFQASETFNGAAKSTAIVPCGVGGANAADWVFDEGDVLGFSLVKNTTATNVDLAVTIVYEYTV